MSTKKIPAARTVKYQVFISSTYTDLKKERQAVVMGILETKNIPAGMELFTAGDESQLKIIKRWIAESDIYMLLLGGRYGSIEPESQLSYTEIEYRYAVELGKPMFALVLDDAGLRNKEKRRKAGQVLETSHPAKYEAFKKLVMSCMCAPFSNADQAQRKTILSLHEIIRSRTGICGWIRNYPYEAVHYGITITTPGTDEPVDSFFEVGGHYEFYPANISCYIVEYNPQLETYWPKRKILFNQHAVGWVAPVFIGHGDDRPREIHVIATGPIGEAFMQRFFDDGELDGFHNLAEDMIIVASRRIILKNNGINRIQ